MPAPVTDSPAPSPQDDTPSTPVAPPADSQTTQLATNFQTLRPIPGHFGGGEWHEAVDQWMGDKHTLMLSLQTHVDGSDYTRAELVQLLGEPDHIITGGDPLFEQINSLPTFETAALPNPEFLVYEWRGTHDFLFFVCQNGTITQSDWWYAGE